jgi:hypothetical protein
VAPSPRLQPGGAAIVGLRRKRMELELKTPWRDGTTHLVMSPLEFMQRLPALIQPAATAFANGCFAAVNPGRQMPGLGRYAKLSIEQRVFCPADAAHVGGSSTRCWSASGG